MGSVVWLWILVHKINSNFSELRTNNKDPAWNDLPPSSPGLWCFAIYNHRTCGNRLTKQTCRKSQGNSITVQYLGNRFTFSKLSEMSEWLLATFQVLGCQWTITTGGKLELTFFETVKLWVRQVVARQFWAIKNRFLCSSSYSSSQYNKGHKVYQFCQLHPISPQERTCITTVVKTGYTIYLRCV